MKIKIVVILLIILLFVGLIPTITIGILSINHEKASLHKEISNGLLQLAEAKEGQTHVYLDAIEGRTIDFSSDGFIRDSLKEISTTGSAKAVKDLNNHLIINKKSLDETIAGILIIDLNGKVVASTDEEEIGSDESKDVYFIEGKKEVFLMSEAEHEHFGLRYHFMVAAPLTDKDTGELLGVIANVFDTKKMHKILSGMFQLEKKALTGKKGRSETFEVYIINKEKTMFIHPRGLGKHYTVPVDTLPVKRCLENGEEIVETYTNYVGKEVIGASMCFPKRGWILITEITTEEAFLPIREMYSKLVLIIMVSVLFIVLISIILSYLFKRQFSKLSKDIEEISKGKIDIQLGKSSIFEIQSLIDSLNRILASLKLAVKKVGLTKEEIKLGEVLKAKKEAERLKKEAEKRYKILFEGAVDAIFIADIKTKKLIDCNKAAEKLIEYNKKEILSMTADKLHPKDKVKETMEAFDKHAAGETGVIYTEILTKNKKRIPIAINTSLVKIDDKTCLQGIFRDISKEIKAEKSLRKRTTELERFAKLVVGREKKMIELKKKIKDLEKGIKKKMKRR